MYVEGAHERKQLVQSGREFKGVPLAATILERGSKTPWISPHEMAKMGFYMILFPTTMNSLANFQAVCVSRIST